MILRLFKRSKKPTARIPDGQRVYAIGDVHGRLDLLDLLLERIDADDARRAPAETRLIFLGDLVDRGPESAGVVERLRVRSEQQNVSILMGNHEEVMLRALSGDVDLLRSFVKIGGRETILSYGVTEEEYGQGDYAALNERFIRHVPASHVEFIMGFEDWVSVGDYLFVHAGIRPGVAVDQQRRNDLRWIREEFLSHRGDHGAVVVHGHTITEAIEYRPNRIGIDTGAYASGRLSAIGLEGTEMWPLEALAAETADVA